ncbi:prepilin-type N-terminal cleavage/methylation domain-containing protein [Clostridium sp. AL.422]|uniref:prepilin-type N-terminal cleavage/methylation domain-containing protein n=1 Tax=Clostridium TaxID=1485 RepID=UPI00293DEB8D|nr:MULTISPECIES: prepilin-type N-terminal cleavage/methylation domain-containing protein [unclassified Clostridium]MDV4149363.1 prepilin-type N-terminal cleavage/methylation domain-containing protein [Clostridium sp. AL.422]
MVKNLKNKKKKKGFTLIELIIVIAIIAILAAIAIPKFGDVRKKANISADIANAKQIQGAVSMVIADGVELPPTGGATFVFDGETKTSDTDSTKIEEAIKNQLQGSTPKIKGATNNGGYFTVEVTKDGQTTVKTAKDGTVIYPNGTGDYAQ